MKQRIDWREVLGWARVVLEVLVMIAAIVGAVLVFGTILMPEAQAETSTYKPGMHTVTGYIICMPGDQVNVRPFSNKVSDPMGWLEPGDSVEMDGYVRNGYRHCVNMAMDDTEGWVHSGYIVFDPPVYVNCKATVISKGRLAARKCVEGRRTRWLKSGATLTVYYYSEYWCVTNCGYVASEFLELEVDPYAEEDGDGPVQG